ncbi:MAG: hypothetical protein GY754_42190 [bacterium]|nr:hypothetical protein [bacterium]
MKPETPRWMLWLIKNSNDWRNKLKAENRIANANDAKLYFCSQGENTKDVDEVVYHLNFGIPLGDLYYNELFYLTSVGAGVTYHSQEEWGNARKRAAACTGCVEEALDSKDSMPPVFYNSLKGAITYLYYGYYHNLDLAKRQGNKKKDSHLHLMKANIFGLITLLIEEYKADIGIYEKAALSSICSKICVGEDKRNKNNKYRKLRTLWECRLFLPMTIDKYGKNEVVNNRCKAIGSIHKYPFDASGTGKPIDTYWVDIEAGTSTNLKWKKRRALIVVAENRDLGNRAGEPAWLIRNAFIPTTDPDAAEKNVKDGWDNLLRLQLGATDRNNGDNDSKQEED